VTALRVNSPTGFHRAVLIFIRPHQSHSMPTVVLAPALARWLTAVPQAGAGEKTVPASGSTVREVLASVFAEYPTLRGYVLDERGALRHHVVAFVNDEPVRDKESLAEPVAADAEVYLFQALSGG
jgi:sulfur-carrier protein